MANFYHVLSCLISLWGSPTLVNLGSADGPGEAWKIWKLACLATVRIHPQNNMEVIHKNGMSWDVIFWGRFLFVIVLELTPA